MSAEVTPLSPWHGLVSDMPVDDLITFGEELSYLASRLGRDLEVRRDHVIALRIARDFANIVCVDLEEAFVVVLGLVEFGHLDESNIGRYDSGAA